MDIEIDKDFAIFYCALLGDGCLSRYGKKHAVVLTCSLADDVPFFEKVISPILSGLRGKETNFRFRRYCGAIEFNFTDKRLFNFIRSVGFPIGKKGNQLCIPQIFYEKRLVNYVLQGYFATDGSFVATMNNGTLYPRVEANGISVDLIREISVYLNKEGILCKHYLTKRHVFDYENRLPQERLQMNGKEQTKKFRELVGFLNPKHEARYQNYLNAVNMALGRIELPTPAS